MCWCCGCFRRFLLWVWVVFRLRFRLCVLFFLKPTRLNREEFLVTWWSLLCTVTILLFFFVIVYCLGLYGGDSLFSLCYLIRTWSSRQRGEGFVCFVLFFCFCLHTISLSPFLLSRSQLYGRVSVLMLGS